MLVQSIPPSFATWVCERVRERDREQGTVYVCSWGARMWYNENKTIGVGAWLASDKYKKRKTPSQLDSKVWLSHWQNIWIVHFVTGRCRFYGFHFYLCISSYWPIARCHHHRHSSSTGELLPCRFSTIFKRR